MPTTKPPFVAEINLDPAPQTYPVLDELPRPNEMVPSDQTVAPLLTIKVLPGAVMLLTPILMTLLPTLSELDKTLPGPETSTRTFDLAWVLPSTNSLPPLVMISWLPVVALAVMFRVPFPPTRFVTTPGPMMRSLPAEATPPKVNPMSVELEAEFWSKITVPLVTANTPTELVPVPIWTLAGPPFVTARTPPAK